MRTFIETVYEILERYKRISLIVILAVIFVISSVSIQLFGGASSLGEYDFLNVGQGDAELVQFHPVGNRETLLLIDTGPSNGMVMKELARLLPQSRTYIDLLAISHPQSDHVGGIFDLMKKYKIGALLYAGNVENDPLFEKIGERATEYGTKIYRVGRQDKIRIGSDMVQVLSPDGSFAPAKDMNDSSLVLEATVSNVRALFTGDMTNTTEKHLRAWGVDDVDIFKVPHHGSRGSVDNSYWKMLHPKLAMIEVGKNNYGHPTKEALQMLQDVNARTYRTDQNGTIRVMVGENRKVTIIDSKN